MLRQASERIPISSLAGLGLSVVSVWTHFTLLADPSYLPWCDVTGRIECSGPLLGPFGRILGIPSVAVSTIWCALVLARVTGIGWSWISVLLAPTGVALVCYWSYGMVLSETICLPWLGLGAAILASALGEARNALGLIEPGSIAPLVPTQRSRMSLGTYTRPTLLVAMVAGAMAFPDDPIVPTELLSRRLVTSSDVPVPAAGNRTGAPTLIEAFLDVWEKRPRRELGIPQQQGEVLIVGFVDYQCSACRRLDLAYRPVIASYQQQADSVRLVIRDFPLEPECNPIIAKPLHPAACEAAAAMRMARRRGTDMALDRWLGTNLKSLTPEAVRQAVARVGGVLDFAESYEKALTEVRQDVSDGVALGVRATPTYFINGRILTEAVPAEVFQAVLDFELAVRPRRR